LCALVYVGSSLQRFGQAFINSSLLQLTFEALKKEQLFDVAVDVTIEVSSETKIKCLFFLKKIAFLGGGGARLSILQATPKTSRSW